MVVKPTDCSDHFYRRQNGTGNVRMIIKRSIPLLAVRPSFGMLFCAEFNNAFRRRKSGRRRR